MGIKALFLSLALVAFGFKASAETECQEAVGFIGVMKNCQASVTIVVSKRNRKSVDAGSGFIVYIDQLDNVAYIVTNAHVVVSKYVRNYLVRYVNSIGNYQVNKAELINLDIQSDLALLRVSGDFLAEVSLGNSASLKLNSPIYSISSPGFIENNSFLMP